MCFISFCAETRAAGGNLCEAYARGQAALETHLFLNLAWPAGRILAKPFREYTLTSLSAILQREEAARLARWARRICDRTRARAHVLIHTRAFSSPNPPDKNGKNKNRSVLERWRRRGTNALNHKKSSGTPRPQHKYFSCHFCPKQRRGSQKRICEMHLFSWEQRKEGSNHSCILHLKRTGGFFLDILPQRRFSFAQEFVLLYLIPQIGGLPFKPGRICFKIRRRRRPLQSSLSNLKALRAKNFHLSCKLGALLEHEWANKEGKLLPACRPPHWMCLTFAAFED
jgi:hypothetical protein